MDVEQLSPNPPKKPKPAKNRNLACLYIGDDRREAITRRAKELGYRSLSAYVVALLDAVGDVAPVDLFLLLRELKTKGQRTVGQVRKRKV